MTCVGLSLDAYIARLLAESNLCSNLASVFDSISQGQIARLTNVNDSLRMSLILRSDLFQTGSERYAWNTGAGATSSTLEAGAGALCPWQTLLPLQDPASMLRELADTAAEADLLAAFLESMTPTINFSEYLALLDIEAPQLQSVVNHLLHWRKARIINVVNLKHAYKPHPQLGLARLPQLMKGFHKLFPSLPALGVVLGRLSSAKSFAAALAGSNRSIALDALVWLLGEGVVIEIRRAYRISVPAHIKARAAQGEPSAVWPLPPAPLSTGYSSTASDPFDSAMASSPSLSTSRRDKRALFRDTRDGLGSAVSFKTTESSEEGGPAAEALSCIVQPARPTAREQRWLAHILADRSGSVREHFEL